MIDYDSLKHFNDEIKQQQLKQEQETRARFNKLHAKIIKNIKAEIQTFIKSDVFEDYIEEFVKDTIANIEMQKTSYTIPFEISCEIDLDNNGDFCICNSEGDVLTAIELLDEDDEDVDNMLDLFDLYFHFDGCEKLDSIAEYFKKNIKQGLANNKLDVKNVSNFEEEWLYDHVVLYSYTIPFVIDLS